MKYLTKTIWFLSLISLFTDTASEMLYPVMPIYLKEIGFSVLIIGILEGFAEALTGLSKSYFGKISDQSQKRVPFVQFGYALSAVSKPLMILFTYPFWIFGVRSLDRLGKGIRTGARDALLSEESTSQNKAKVFGFHRSMDTLGAVVGPLMALIYLYYFPKDYTTLFLIAFIPGLFAIIITSFLKDKSKNTTKIPWNTTFFPFLNYWKESSINYKKLAFGLWVFALVNSSDVFLILKAKNSGLNDTWVLGIYIFYNLIYALFAFPMGILADKIGIKKVFIIGLFIFGLVYFGMALPQNLYGFIGLFFLYGIYAASTEGIAKAWISNIVEKEHIATAIGTYAGFQSICALFASSFAGFLWNFLGSEFTFITSAVVSWFLMVYFAKLKEK